MSITVTYNLGLSAVETIPCGDVATDVNTTHNVNTTAQLSGSTSVPVSVVWSGKDRTLAGTTETIDMTALTDGAGLAVNLNGYKPQVVHISAADTNTGTMSFEAGTSNGYNLFGSAGKITLPADGAIQLYLADQMTDISGSAKTLKVSGTVGDKYSIIIVVG